MQFDYFLISFLALDIINLRLFLIINLLIFTEACSSIPHFTSVELDKNIAETISEDISDYENLPSFETS